VNHGFAIETRLSEEISAMRDTDLAVAAVELTNLHTSIQAALQARANFELPTLFDLRG
jgi:flagellin-like hook-associated protein FlgL